MDQNIGRCRGCGRAIIWLKTKAGRPMPCDPEPVKFRPMTRFGPDQGPEKFMTMDGLVRRGVRDPEGEMVGHVSHFATCPKADGFRRKGRNDGEPHPSPR